jgi:hypothetical protein
VAWLNEILTALLQGAAILVLLQLGRYLSTERRVKEEELRLLLQPAEAPMPSELMEAIYQADGSHDQVR